MKIVIPTWKRLDRQITLKNLEKIREHVWLVVREEEYTNALKLHHQVKYITDPVSNFPETIEWICKKGFPGELIYICDDDLTFTKYAPHPDFAWLKPIKGGFDAQEMYDTILQHAANYVHGGLFCNVAPIDKSSYPFKLNGRYWSNKWYDLGKVDANTLDFTSILAAEDFNVMLQLYDRGYDGVLSFEFCASGSATNSSGGCSVYRTVDNHNRSMEQLAEKFPQYVKLYKKVQKSGPWAGLEKYGARISMRKKKSNVSDIFD